MSNNFGTTAEFSATPGSTKSGAGGDLPTMPDPSKNDPDGGQHLPTMPDPANEPERGQELPTDHEPGAKLPTRIEDPPRTEDEKEERRA